MNNEVGILLLVLLGCMSFLYSSVGHGGASGYLAVMGLFSFPPTIMKPTALLLNILVSAIAFLFYYREKLFKWKLFYPFAITSIPFSFLGGYIKIDPTYYKVLLALVLLISIVRILFYFKKDTKELKPVAIHKALLIGAFIGFLSGMLGIGGGILLSPLILILGWADMKQTAAVSALFIFVNSISGFFGFISHGGAFPNYMLPVLCIVCAGGLLGGYLGAKKFNTQILRYVLSAVLLVASLKLIIV
jgi:uncharacterized membrane protein YfcA